MHLSVKRYDILSTKLKFKVIDRKIPSGIALAPFDTAKLSIKVNGSSENRPKVSIGDLVRYKQLCFIFHSYIKNQMQN